MAGGAGAPDISAAAAKQAYLTVQATVAVLQLQQVCVCAHLFGPCMLGCLLPSLAATKFLSFGAAGVLPPLPPPTRTAGAV